MTGRGRASTSGRGDYSRHWRAR